MVSSKKEWLKQSPCRGCLSLDSDTAYVGSGVIHYCEIVSDPEPFYEHFFGKTDDSKEKRFRNCQFKSYLK